MTLEIHSSVSPAAHKAEPMRCIAHRGGPKAGTLDLPENSLAAIARAIEIGVDAIEIDIFCAAGELWVTHDRVLGRTISGDGVITDLSKNYLDEQVLANGEGIPRLTDVLQLVGDKTLLNIEIKGPNVVPTLARCLREYVINYHGSFEQYIISSFDHPQLYQALLSMPQVRRGVLIEGIPLDYAAVCDQLDAWSLNSDLAFVNAELLSDAKKRGLKNWVYTVNRKADWQLMKQMGVDGIFTDIPDQFNHFLYEQSE